MFTHEKDRLNSINTNYSVSAKAVDDEDPKLDYKSIRGFGGVAIFYKKDIEHCIQLLPDGSHRILAMTVNASPNPLCIVNVYMPSAATPGEEEYLDTLAEVREIIDKFSTTHTLIACGDWNASLHRDSRRRDVIFTNFVKNHLNTPSGYPVKDTFFHHNGNSSSQIDYILTSGHTAPKDIRIHIHDMDPINTSDHSATTAVIKLGDLTRRKPVCPIKLVKPKWSKCDIPIFQQTIEDHIGHINHNDVESTIKTLDKLLHTAGHMAIPSYRKLKCLKPAGRGTWNHNISEASRESKKAHHAWKKSKSLQDKITAVQKKRKLRQLQRQATAQQKAEEINQIMEASEGDSKLFHKLINKQRKSGNSTASTGTLIVNNQELSDRDSILEGWRTHFTQLATPDLSSPNFNLERLTLSTLQNSLLDDREAYGDPIPTIKEDEVASAIKKLKTGKSADIDGISAEHYKTAGDSIISPVTDILNSILANKSVPHSQKRGILTPVPKKGKDVRFPGSYRGITVTTTFSKILETVLQTRLDAALEGTQNPLQRGFTTGTSSLSAAFIVSEAILEAKKQNNILYLTTLDAQKAFDTVNHDILLNKLFHAGITGHLWLLLRDMYQDMTVKIKYNDTLSEEVHLQQGIRQGAKLSTTLYKQYNNTILNSIRSTDLGTFIGSINTASPTCADDISILTDNIHHLQPILNIVQDNVNNDLVTINADKSEIVAMTRKPDLTNFQLNGNLIPKQSKTKHLGIVRNNIPSANIEDRVNTGRRTFYALLGPGLFSRRGWSPLVTSKLWKTYVVPRCTYGLEVLVTSSKDISKLETMQRKVYKQIQGLPTRTATSAVYLLLGAEPIESTVHRNLLSLFASFARNVGSVEHQILTRQLSMSDPSDGSFISRVRLVLDKYSLPSPEDFMRRPQSKPIWKTMVKHAVDEFWYNTWDADCRTKPTLQHLRIQSTPTRTPHVVWASVPNTTHDVQQAEVKVRLLTDTYMLQYHKGKFNQYSVSQTCVLCNEKTEDRQHFILECSKLNEVRKPFLSRLEIYINSIREDAFQDIVNNSLLLQLTLDSSVPTFADIAGIRRTHVPHIESLTRRMCYNLHLERTKLMMTTL